MQDITLKHMVCSVNPIDIPIVCKYVYQKPLEAMKDIILSSADCQIGKGEFVGMICPQTDKCPMKTIPKTIPYPY